MFFTCQDTNAWLSRERTQSAAALLERTKTQRVGFADLRSCVVANAVLFLRTLRPHVCNINGHSSACLIHADGPLYWSLAGPKAITPSMMCWKVSMDTHGAAKETFVPSSRDLASARFEPLRTYTNPGPARVVEHLMSE